MSTTHTDYLGEISRAKDYFVPRRADGARPVSGAGETDSVMKTIDGSLGATLDLQQTLSPQMQALADEQHQNLMNLLGMGSAQLRYQANKKKDPGWIHNWDAQKDIYAHYPLLNYQAVEHVEFQESLQSVTLATVLLQRILGFAVAGAIPEFGIFLAGLQKEIKAGIHKSHQVFNTVAFPIVLKVDNNGYLEARLDCYAVKFEETSKVIETSCSEFKRVEINFEYNVIQGSFNYGQMKTDPAVKKRFDDLIHEAAIDDIDGNKDNYWKHKIEKTPGESEEAP